MFPFLVAQVPFNAEVLGVADKVVEAIQSGALKHVFVIGGCDGTENSRSYFTDLAADTPQDVRRLLFFSSSFFLSLFCFGAMLSFLLKHLADRICFKHKQTSCRTGGPTCVLWGI